MRTLGKRCPRTSKPHYVRRDCPGLATCGRPCEKWIQLSLPLSISNLSYLRARRLLSNNDLGPGGVHITRPAKFEGMLENE